MNIYQEFQALHGYTARQAAGAIGVPVSTWRKWLASTRTPRHSARVLVQMALDHAKATKAQQEQQS